MRPATSMFPQALRCVPGSELSKFLRNPHLEMMQETPLYSRNDGPPQDGFAEANLGSGRINVTAGEPSLVDIDADQTA